MRSTARSDRPLRFAVRSGGERLWAQVADGRALEAALRLWRELEALRDAEAPDEGAVCRVARDLVLLLTGPEGCRALLGAAERRDDARWGAWVAEQLRRGLESAQRQRVAELVRAPSLRRARRAGWLRRWRERRGFPRRVRVGGRLHRICADWRVVGAWMGLMEHPLLGEAHKWQGTMRLFFRRAPRDAVAAWAALQEFLLCGRPVPTGRGGARCWDFEEDYLLLWAAFAREYGIDLNRAALHWWEFRARLDELSETCALKRQMGARLARAGEGESDGEKQ